MFLFLIVILLFIFLETHKYRVQTDTASDYGGYKRKKKSMHGNLADSYSNQRLPSRPQSSCAITQIPGNPERRW